RRSTSSRASPSARSDLKLGAQRAEPVAHRAARVVGCDDPRVTAELEHPAGHPLEALAIDEQLGRAVVLHRDLADRPGRADASDRQRIELDAYGDGIRARHVEPLAPVRFEIEIERALEALAGRAQRGDPIDPERADVAALVAEAHDVPFTGVMDDAVRIDRPALVAVTRRRHVIDLEPLALARRRDERAQVRRD